MPYSYAIEVLAYIGIPLVFTALIEIGVALLMRLRSMRSVLAVVLINAVTNPATNVLALVYLDRKRNAHYPFYDEPVLWLLEAVVVVIEAALLNYALRLPMRRALLVSFVMNLASLVLGLTALGVVFNEFLPGLL